ncbi:MAG: hypothetical protein ACFFG0_02355 [Candidatus Thorarchaeota archaeon]
MLSEEERIKAAEEQIQNDIKNKDSGGFAGKQILNFDSIGGYTKELFFKPKTGQTDLNRLDIIPFIAGPQNVNGITEGSIAYKVDLWVHRFVGPSKSSFICLQSTFGKPCPICEEREALMHDPSVTQKEIDSLKPKHRAWYNVRDMDIPQAPVQIFEESFYLFQKELMLAAGVGGRITIFHDITLGKTVEFVAVPKSSEYGKHNEYRQFSFRDRGSYTEEIYKYAFPLDKMVNIPTYDEVKAAHLGLSDDDLPETKQKSESPITPGGVPEAKTAVPGGIPQSVGGGLPPESSLLRPTIPELQGNVEENVCPKGHTFGKDCDEFRDCTSCHKETWKLCDQASKSMS